MPQRTSHLHIAIIMDGNGRWAQARGWPRLAGHRAGAKAVERTVEAARALGVGTLTLYAFSSDNWRRPAEETSGLMRLFEDHLKGETGRCLKNGIRINIVGRRDRLASRLKSAIEAAERATAHCHGMDLRIAIDYSAREAILDAACQIPSGTMSHERFAEKLAEVNHCVSAATDVDLLIRTGGEQRLSDFLLWECAYAELLFVPKMWPEFDAKDLEEAILQFHSRERRFGGLAPAAA